MPDDQEKFNSWKYTGYGNEHRVLCVDVSGHHVDGMAGAASYDYLANSGLLESVSMLQDGAATAVTATYGYEPRRNVKTLVTNQFGAEKVSEYGYGYDKIGRRTSVTNSGNAFENPAFNIYGYNSRNELISSNRYLGTSILDTASPVNDEARAYHYDPIGNRISVQQDYDISASAPITSTYVANALNQYESVTAGGTTIALDYDDDGNLIHKDGVQYVFNCENRLVEVAPLAPTSGDTRVTFAYDYMGRRFLKQSYVYASGDWSLVSTSTSIWNGWNRIQEKTVLAADSSEEVKSYIWGLDLSQSTQGAGGVGGLLAVVDDDSEVDFFLYDANGNVGQLVNALTGILDAHYEYDPFGRLLKATGAKANQNTYRFSTKSMDQETGLYYYGYRYLDVELGRWVSRDPIEEAGHMILDKNEDGSQSDENLYLFARSDVINNFDYLGLSRYNVYYTLYAINIPVILTTLVKIEGIVITMERMKKGPCRCLYESAQFWGNLDGFGLSRAPLDMMVNMEQEFVDVKNVKWYTGWFANSETQTYSEPDVTRIQGDAKIAGFTLGVKKVWSLGDMKLGALFSESETSPGWGWGLSYGAVSGFIELKGGKYCIDKWDLQ
ncbi:MAG: hypothetical protein JEZ02_19240 [Desulfatibacillum sp.]|nr:hypothetical protein [Desulfatibacillum sp.]